MLLKGEVLGLRLTNNLIMELEKTYNGGVGIGALQRCEPGVHGTGSSHGAVVTKKIDFLCDNPSRSLGFRRLFIIKLFYLCIQFFFYKTDLTITHI